eukprot:TRINITY_DN15812_c0_g1_i2.p1 TRINITY_DN15812_c0_g1~~TRINITY_DN15812_c0_g1_i2.p1  ORF type:complete len:534 (+),score=177.19 TRINITY_DN15812_c0_g1_i2:103-1704(+)
MPLHFEGRSLSVVNDLTPDEQYYLYNQTRKLKEAVKKGEGVQKFKIQAGEKAVYLIFMEDSTRTKESFRNAALFHGCKMNVFDAATSSFNKKESITDTVKMLCGYSTDQSIFVVRSKLEGTCTWLDKVVGEYCGKLGLPRASFINAGDGRHEHPTQEFLDEFSFLEQKNWDRSQIHLVLTGDLYHGRTVHSKTDGLRVFHKVKVDLIAPTELAMPAEYEERMIANNFIVRKFNSIDEYLQQDDIASIWYYTRLQLERMGDKILGREEYLRRAVTFRKEFLGKIPKDSKFYHPLPRHQKYPVVPLFLDNTSYNAYDGQSVNGYFTRIIELSMCGGALGEDFTGEGKKVEETTEDFVEKVDMESRREITKGEMKMGIKPVSNGLVLDHICRGTDVKKVWKTIAKLTKILQLSDVVGTAGVFSSRSQKDAVKGIVSLPTLTESFFDKAMLKKLSAISPECTLNVIEKDRVVTKYRLHMPPRIYDFEEIDCTNATCISHRKNHEHAMADFVRKSVDPPAFSCAYCEKPHNFDDIWAI